MAIDQLKKLKEQGQTQAPFLFRINMLGTQFTARSTTIPYSFDREIKLIRLAGNKEFVIPAEAVYTTHEWDISYMFFEQDKNFKILDIWYFNVDNLPLQALKVNATIDLLALDYSVTNTFYLAGVFPKKLAGPGELNHDDVEGYMTYDLALCFDDIYFGKDGITKRNLI